MEIINLLRSLNHTFAKLDVNYKLMPTSRVSKEHYNQICDFFNKRHNLNVEDPYYLNQGFAKTNSGGISTAQQHRYTNLSTYECRRERSYVEIVVQCLLDEDESFCGRIQHWFGESLLSENDQKKMCGAKAFNILKKEFETDHIYLEDYYITNGKEIKKTIPSPLIKIENKNYIDLTLEHCYHIDLRSAYPYAMTIYYPEWSDTIKRLYSQRKFDRIKKDVLNMAYGWFQCRYFGYKLADVSKFCVEHTIKRLLELKQELIEKYDAAVIAYNTDGIWFQTNNSNIINDYKGVELGDAHIDHIASKLRFKSPGSYEFIEMIVIIQL